MNEKVEKLLNPLITETENYIKYKNNDVDKGIDSRKKSDYILSLVDEVPCETVTDLEMIHYMNTVLDGFFLGLLKFGDLHYIDKPDTAEIFRNNILDEIKNTGYLISYHLYACEEPRYTNLTNKDKINMKKDFKYAIDLVLKSTYYDDNIMKLLEILLTSNSRSDFIT